MENNFYRTYSGYLKEIYQEKVYKLPINLPISCPNRQNNKGGCSFCGEVGTGFESMENNYTVTEQMMKDQETIKKKYKAHKFIAYFQNYTNTWMPLKQFEAYMQEAAEFPNIVEISVSTRPDCIKSEYLDVLEKISKEKNIRITIELGLQTVNYHTLKAMNRGHGLGAFLASVLLIHTYGFQICTHLILNLPNDTMDDIREATSIIAALPINIAKLHSLYIPKNSKLSFDYENGKICICSSQEYIKRLIFFVEHSRKDLVIERLFSRIPEEDSTFSNWGKSWWLLLDEFNRQMSEKESYQGKYYIPENEAAFYPEPFSNSTSNDSVTEKCC